MPAKIRDVDSTCRSNLPSTYGALPACQVWYTPDMNRIRFACTIQADARFTKARATAPGRMITFSPLMTTDSLSELSTIAKSTGNFVIEDPSRPRPTTRPAVLPRRVDWGNVEGATPDRQGARQRLGKTLKYEASLKMLTCPLTAMS